MIRALCHESMRRKHYYDAFLEIKAFMLSISSLGSVSTDYRFLINLWQRQKLMILKLPFCMQLPGVAFVQADIGGEVLALDRIISEHCCS